MSNMAELHDLVADLESMQALLEREQRCLSGAQPSSLDSIVTAKAALLARIGVSKLSAADGSGAGLASLGNVPQTLRDKLQRLVAGCNRLNEENRALSHQRVKTVGQSLGLIRSVMEAKFCPDAVNLYDASGRQRRGAIKRELGDV